MSQQGFSALTKLVQWPFQNQEGQQGTSVEQAIFSSIASQVLQQPQFDYSKVSEQSETRLGRLISTIFSSDFRYYFDVDNQYVVKKLAILSAPFLARGEWNQGQIESNSTKHMGFAQPRLNVHAPDLYIPLMSFLTFILLCCFARGYGEQGNFEPGDIVYTFWKCGVVSSAELVIFIIVFCLLENKGGTLDLISHLNYRYVILCYSIILNIVLGGVVTMVVTWYLLVCQGLFVYKTLLRYSDSSRYNSLELSHFGSKIILLLSGINPFLSWVLLKLTGEY